MPQEAHHSSAEINATPIALRSNSWKSSIDSIPDLATEDTIVVLAGHAELGQCRSRRPHPDTRQAFRLHHLQMLYEG